MMTFRKGKRDLERVPSAAHFGKGTVPERAAKSKPEYSWVIARSFTGRNFLLEPAPASERQAAQNRIKGCDAVLDAALGFLEYGKFEKALDHMQLFKEKTEVADVRQFSAKILAVAEWESGGLRGKDLADAIAARVIAADLLPKSLAFEKRQIGQELEDAAGAQR